MSESTGALLSVVVLSCGSLGVEVAERLLGVPGVGCVTLVTAPYRQPSRSIAGKIRHVHRMQGWRGLAAVAVRRLVAPLREREAEPSLAAAAGGPSSAIPHLHFPDFHDPACLLALRRLNPDLGVIAGTYILKESVFGVPRLGSINLHSGKVPEYRGAAPAFWELYNGETQVGITIHRVAAAVDAGGVLLQELFPLDPAPSGDPMELFPLDPAPSGDPMAYVERIRNEVLRPNGVRMLAEAVARIADGTMVETPQHHAAARVYRSPDHRAIRELRRRVRERRRGRES